MKKTIVLSWLIAVFGVVGIESNASALQDESPRKQVLYPPSRPDLTYAAITPENIAKARVFCDINFIADTIREPIPGKDPKRQDYDRSLEKYALEDGVYFLANLKWYAALFNFLDHEIASNVMGESPSTVRTKFFLFYTPGGYVSLSFKSNKDEVKKCCSHLLAYQKEKVSQSETQNAEYKKQPDSVVFASEEDKRHAALWNTPFACGDNFKVYPLPYLDRPIYFGDPKLPQLTGKQKRLQAIYVLLYHWQYNSDLQENIEQVLSSMLDPFPYAFAPNRQTATDKDFAEIYTKINKNIEEQYPALKIAYEKELEAVRSCSNLDAALTPPIPLDAVLVPRGVKWDDVDLIL